MQRTRLLSGFDDDTKKYPAGSFAVRIPYFCGTGICREVKSDNCRSAFITPQARFGLLLRWYGIEDGVVVVRA